MAQAKIPGGAYLSADGKTWHDAEGKTIPNPSPPSDVVTPVTPSPAPVVESKPIAEPQATESEPTKKPTKKPAEK